MTDDISEGGEGDVPVRNGVDAPEERALLMVSEMDCSSVVLSTERAPRILSSDGEDLAAPNCAIH